MRQCFPCLILLKDRISESHIHLIILIITFYYIPCMCPLLFYCSHNVNTFYSHLFQQILRCPGISCADGFFPNQRTINILIIQCVLIIIHRIYKIFENVLDLLILCLTSLCTCKCLLCCIFNLLLSGFSLLLCADIRWMKLCIIFVYRHF